MATIDNRVVEMGFDGSKFGSGVNQTLSMLDRLKAALHLGGASKGLQDINAAAGQFNSAPMEQGVSRIGSAFSSMQAVAFGALANIGAKVSDLAINTAKSLTIAPIAEGFSDYNAKLTSVQTIMNATGADIKVVDGYFKELDTYADKTIYNLTDMTGAFAKFTNAGVDMDKSVPAIKGIANMVAVAGQGADAASIAMYNLSQSIAGGFLTTTDYKSLNLANVATKEWKQQMIDGAVAAGTLKKTGEDAYHVVGMKAGTASSSAELFNDNLAEGWATSDVLMDVLGKYGDSTTDIGKKSLAAAQDVKSLPMMMDTLKASVGTGWTDTFEILLGDVNESKKLFTEMTNSIGGFLDGMSNSRNDLLQGWKDLGGRENLIVSLKMAFENLGRVITPIYQAFRMIFPKTTSEQLMEMTRAFQRFMYTLRPSAETFTNIRRTAAGVFAIFGIGWEILKAVTGFFFDLFKVVGSGSGSILSFTANIGDFLVSLHRALKTGQGLNQFFDMLFSYVMKVVTPIKNFTKALGEMFSGVNIDFGAIGGGLGDFITSLLTFGKAAESAGESAGKSESLIMRFVNFFKNLAGNIAGFVAPLGENLAGAFQNIDYEKVMKALEVGMLGGIAFFLKNIGSMFSNINIFGGKGAEALVGNVTDSLDNLSGTLGAMQANLKASMLLKIAAAVAALAISVVLLSGVDAAGLARATTALTVMFVQLAVAMNVLQGIGTVASVAKMNLMGAALILLGVAILVLVGAMKVLATMSWEDLAKGMAGLVVMLAVIVGLAKGLDRVRGAILRASVAMVFMGGALHILISAVKRMGEIDLVTMARGLGGIALLLIGLAIFTRLQKSSAKAVAQAISIVLLALALEQLAKVVAIFGTMSLDTMAKGFAGIAGGLVAMGIALKFMPSGPKLIMTAFGVGKVAGAFGLMALAFQAFENISWDQIARGLTAIGGSLLIVTVALKKMPKPSLTQIVSLLALAWAIKQIVQSLVMIGSMDMEQLAKAMGVFTGVLATIVIALNSMKGTAEGAGSIAAVAGSLQMLEETLGNWGKLSLEELAKGIGAMAAVLAILTISLNMLKTEAAGAVALAAVAGALSLLVPVLTTLGAMPLIAIGAALVALAGMFLILVLGLKLLQPLIPVLMALSIAIALIGVAVALAGAGLLAFSTGLIALGAAGAVGAAGIVAIVSSLVGLIPLVMEQIGLGIIAFAEVIANAGPAILQAITAVLIAFLQAIIDVTPKVVETLLTLLFAFLHTLDVAVPRIVQSGMNLLLALLRGIADNIGKIVHVVTDIIVNFLNALGRELPRIIQAGIDLIISFVEGLAQGIRDNAERMGEAGVDLATAIIEGMIKGIGAGAMRVVNKVKGLAGDALNAAKDFLGINSPSRKFAEIGMGIDEGMAKGIGDYTHLVTNATDKMGGNVVDAMGKTISGLGRVIENSMTDDLNPVITPVLDLSGVRKDASGIGSIFESNPLSVDSAYSGAARASAGYESNQTDNAEMETSQPVETVSFVQNNHSPKALSAIEIYRQTQNQLSVAKGALKRTP